MESKINELLYRTEIDSQTSKKNTKTPLQLPRGQVGEVGRAGFGVIQCTILELFIMLPVSYPRGGARGQSFPALLSSLSLDEDSCPALGSPSPWVSFLLAILSFLFVWLVGFWLFFALGFFFFFCFFWFALL